MTFRARLQQAIIGLVAAATGASLFIAQRQNGASHQEMLDQLFEQQFSSFRREQQRDIELAEKNARRLSDSVRLFAVLEAGDPDAYQVAKDEMRLDDFDFFRLIDAEGAMIDPPTGTRANAGLFSPKLQETIHEQLKPATPQNGMSVGYVVLRPEEHSPLRIYRALSAPIRNFESTVGSLVIGQEMSGFAGGEEAKFELKGGMWLNGQLIGDAFPADLSHEIQQQLGGATKLTPTESVERMFRFNGAGYRLNAHLLNPGSPFPPAHFVSVFSLAGFEAQQRKLILQIIGLGLGAIVVASLIGALFARQVTQPIQSLVAATQSIQGGNFQPAIVPGSTQEMRRLADAFLDMGAGLALKERYHSVLSMVADRRVAEELMAGKIQLGGELREVSVIFCDIRGYTALSAGRDPREVIELLNQHMGALTRVVYRHHGVINQFAGDAIMILFGAPTDNANHAQDAVQCAREMLAERERLNAVTHEPLDIGFGIATGKVVAGCLGSENRADYTVIGDRVNLAARLCSVAAAGEIVMDDQTRAALPESVLSAATEPLKLKGFSEPVIGHRLVS
ncbi:MAG: adenylate/guanylate cyclase domain-containing protein [Verrucomicrobiota bacterium]